MSQVKFGTDGWRAIISETFTMANVESVSQAIADVIVKRPNNPSQAIVIGYDTRFMSQDFAQRIAEVLAANGLKVILSTKVAPTPVVSYMVKQHNAAGGIVVTASHNPYKFNGIKFKDYYGGPASPELTAQFEASLDQTPVKSKPFHEGLKDGSIVQEDFDQAYFAFLESYLNMDLIRKSAWAVAIDAMHGAGQTYFETLLGTQFAGKVTTIHSDVNPSFGGVNPEPISQNLKELMGMCSGDYDLGLATDGDGDRIGVVDDQGRFVYSHQLIALFILYLMETRSWTGGVAKSISTTALVNVIAKDKNLDLYETPIGFKHICTLMCEKDILVGGEESGGIGFKNHVPERDGLLAGLLVLEMMCHYQKPLSQILADMEHTYGRYYYQRNDVHYDISLMDQILGGLSKLKQETLDGEKVDKVLTEDGIKQVLVDGSWLLIRGSGTEPVLRIYAESQSEERVGRLLAIGEELALGQHQN